MKRTRTSSRQLGYAVTGTILAVSLSGCGLAQGSGTSVASAPAARDDAIFVDARQAQGLQQLLTEAKAEAAAEAALQAQAPQTKKDRRAAQKARDEALAAAAAASPAAGNAALFAKVEQAEAQVLAAPLDAAPRIALAEAYLAAGRFDSASASFADAALLAPPSGQVSLQHALALMGHGKLQDAVQILDQQQVQIPVADLGLAFALAGHTDRAIAVLSDAIRGGESTVKIRQNLAYSYALANRWRHARVMAAQDVPAHAINERIEEWSRTAQPDAWQARIAGLLNVPANAYDRGMPLELALGNFADDTQVAQADEDAVLAEAATASDFEQSDLAAWNAEHPAATEPVAAMSEPVQVATQQISAPFDAAEAVTHHVAEAVHAPLHLAVADAVVPTPSAAALTFDAPASAALDVAPAQLATVSLEARAVAPLAQGDALVAATPVAVPQVAAPQLAQQTAVAALASNPAPQPVVAQGTVSTSVASVLPTPAPALERRASAEAPATFAHAQVSTVPAPRAAAVIAQAPAPQSAAPVAAAQPALVQRSKGAHVVQLGSFLSERDAKRAVETYRARYTSLEGRELQISEAMVRGKRYFRVSAAGYNFSGSKAVCSEVKQSGEVCLAYSTARTMPGTIARGRRFVRL